MDETQKSLFELFIAEIIKEQLICYIRTTSMISAKTNLKISDFCEIRYISALEAKKIGTQVREGNVFARYYRVGGPHFYVRRARELGDHTIIEIFLPGKFKEAYEEAEEFASNLEKIAILSSTLALKKGDLQKRLGISNTLGTNIDFGFSPDFYSLRSKKSFVPTGKGICLDDKFHNRFFNCGFGKLVEYLRSNDEVALQVSKSINWLFDSRIEPRPEASVVKTSIALESLLIFDKSESLARSLSERSAFILSSDPNKRRQISRIIKDFYNIRSGIVHGNRTRREKLIPAMLESVDRLVIMLCLVVAENSNLWPTKMSLQEWCEEERWGEPSRNIVIPFPNSYINNALKLSHQG